LDGPGKCHWSVGMNLRVDGRTYLHEYVTNLSLQGEHVSHNLLCTSDVGMCIQKAVQPQWKIESMSVSNHPRCQQSSTPRCCSATPSQKSVPLTSRVDTDAVQEVEDVNEHNHRCQTQVELAFKGFLIVKELFFRHCLRNGDSCVRLDLGLLDPLHFFFLSLHRHRVGDGVLCWSRPRTAR
jgi:hypothetical protein